MTLDENVVRELESARGYAKQGNASAMSDRLELALIFAAKAGQDISGQVTQIETEGYKKVVSLELESARGYAEKGNVPFIGSKITLAQTYAKRIGQDISGQVTQIETEGYLKAIPTQLESARGYAEKGDAARMFVCLQYAETYAKRVGQDISGQVVGIMALIPH